MDTIFMNSKIRKTSKPHILKLNLADKLDIRIGEKVIALSNLSIYWTWKNIKSSNNNDKFKNLHQHGIKNLHYQMHLILYQIFRIISKIF